MEKWDFSINKAADAVWTEGLREIFEYRDLGIKEATKGDYIAHIVKANGKEMKDAVLIEHDTNPNYDKEYFVFKGSSRIEAAVKMGYTHIEGIII